MFDSMLLSLDTLLLVVFPYIAAAVFLLVSIQRYRGKMFTYSSLSSQFLENQHHFWALVPFHYGIIALALGHLIGFLLPAEVLSWNSNPLRLYVLEVSALIFGLLTFVGLIGLIVRRLRDPKLRIVTSRADRIVLSILLLNVFSGLYVALFHGWGSSWFAASAAPYLWSIVTLSPDAASVSAMPFMVKAHIVMAWVLVAVFPFTRLVHVLVVPNHYLWRRPQVVRWYGIRRLINRRA
ncbi:MAG: respiratory nitrate reductase subunit gamma [Bacteroidia bacterium]|nr:respiratory nitrate reductase subunit gamma [Bacteroidia bacterium]